MVDGHCSIVGGAFIGSVHHHDGVAGLSGVRAFLQRVEWTAGRASVVGVEPAWAYVVGLPAGRNVERRRSRSRRAAAARPSVVFTANSSASGHIGLAAFAALSAAASGAFRAVAGGSGLVAAIDRAPG